MRTHPVERHEVVLRGSVSEGFKILTVPEDACIPRGDSGWSAGVIEELIAPLVSELQRERLAWMRTQEWGRELTEKDLRRREVQALGRFERCKQCGRRFVHTEQGPGQLKRCSDACIEASKLARRGAWVKRRTAQRSERRDGKRCEHCGEAFVAKRATRRYCSDRCRVAAFRAPGPTVTLEELGLA